MRKIYVFLTLLFLAVITSYGQTSEQIVEIQKSTNVNRLLELEKDFQINYEENRKKVIELAKSKNIPVVIEKEGVYAELQYFDEAGNPIYYITDNVDAARSTRTNHLNIGGSLGLNLDGQNMTGYVWDGGHARVTHQEYDGPGGSNRVSIADAASEGGTDLNFHAAHVTGTITASGVDPDAKGMAPRSRVRGYKWNNDLSEATNAAANGMLVSNHSYGFRASAIPDYYFGAYITQSRDWDNVMYNAPYYLMVVSAGNDGNDNSSNAAPLGGNSSYDKLSGQKTAKNNLVVANAQDANVAANGDLISVSRNSSSSEGPTDDLRIKPDITGNGTSVYSTYESSDTAYASITGTSMAAPNVAGSLLLLQQHYNNLNGNFMRAATLKGLVLHTADDVGTTGPDPLYGWGLLNSKKAAEAISDDGTSSIIDERSLSSGQSYSITVQANGIDDLQASISWTDLAGTATTSTNSSVARLVNDLDIRVTKNSSTFNPWRLTGVSTNGKGDNTRDPYERIDIQNASGSYTITVTHKGSLSTGSQAFTLIVTGVNVGNTGGNPCSGGITSYPYTESFESGLGVWTQSSSDDINWTRDSAGTPSNNTGPNNGSAGSWYLFVEASGNGTGYPNKTAVLNSPCFDLSAVSGATFDFDYHMFGAADMGTISLQASTDGGSSWSPLWSESGNKGDVWNSQSIDLTAYAGSSVQLRFSRTTGSTWQADIAIDNINLSTGSSGGNSCPSEVSLPYSQSWDSSFADWVQSADDDIDWSRLSGGTPSGNTGPTGAINGSHYIYVEASGNGTGYPNKQAILNSPCVNIPNQGAAEVSFNYHMFGAADMGSISLDVTNNDGTNWNTLWSQSGNQGNSWQSVNIDLSSYAGDRIQLRFNRVTGSTWQADIAIDNFSIAVNSGCSNGVALPYNESFESSLGAWTQSNQDDINWTRDSNGTPSNGTGPSNGSNGSFYLFVEASGNGTGYPNKRAILNSPCINLSGTGVASVNFDYHMFGAADMGSIALEASGDDGDTWDVIWSESGNKGNTWNSASVSLNSYTGGGVQLRFNRLTGSTWQADVAIDNIRVTTNNATNTSIAYNVDSVFDPGLEVELEIYPNPINQGQILNVKLTGAIGKNITIYNISGQSIISQQFTDRLELGGLKTGSYFISVQTDKENLTAQFVIN